MSDELPPRTRLHEYEIIETLGRGGFGITYLARDTRLGRKVAIKEYFPEFATRSGEQTISARSEQHAEDYQRGLDSFIEEAKALARFDHPNIVKAIRLFEKNSSAYLVMEHVAGHSLSAELKENKTLPEHRVRKIVDALLEGLEQAHAVGLLHRDIKPGNVMLRQDGRPVLIDFGAARNITGQHSRTLTAVLTPGYAPIEQYGSQGEQGPWTDIYSVGALAYKCLSGKTPADATDRFRQDRMPRVAEASPQKLDANFAWVVDMALRVEESERPQTIAEWRYCIEKAKRGLTLGIALSYQYPLDSKGQPDLKALQDLIGACTDINAKDEDGRAPLHFVAMYYRGPEILQSLVDAGADVNAEGEKGRVPLHYFLGDEPNLKTLQALIDAGAEVNAQDEDEWAPLHYAVFANSDPEVLHVLIDTGADINAKDKNSNTPLCYAIEEDRQDILKILIDAGADVEETIMCWQSQYNHPSLGGRSLLLYAIVEMYCQPEILQSLADDGEDVNEKDRYGYSLLHYVLQEDPDPETLKVLLNAGADVSVENVKRDTPLHIAARCCSNLETFTSLVNACSAWQINKLNVWGMTPLHYAAGGNSNPEILQALIDAGADVSGRNSGRTCMRINLSTGENNFVDPCSSSMLLSCLQEFTLPDGIDLELLPESFYCDVADDQIPNFEDSIEMARNEGVNVWVDPQDSWNGRMPLHHAAEGNPNPEVLQVLVSAGADVNAKDANGQTPLDLAKDNPNPEIQEWRREMDARLRLRHALDARLRKRHPCPEK